LALVRRGLIPSRAKDAKIGFRLINARADTVATKPSFRSAFKWRRCLVPADGFYEWQKVGKGKQPFYILRKDEEPFVFAGLWEAWENPGDDNEVQS
jgi:putative SOS response-associated peptidase YedK